MAEKTETDGRKQKGNGRDEMWRGTDGRRRTDRREKKGRERQLDNERENYREGETFKH